MKSKMRAFIVGLVLFFSIGIMGHGVQAASASASASPSSVDIGDTVTVTVTFKNSNIGAVSGSFSYDTGSLQYLDGNNTSNGLIAGVAGASGQSSITATMRFKALKSGTHKVQITASEILDFDMNDLGTASTSVNVVVAAPKPATSTNTTTSNTSKTTTVASTPAEPEPDPMENAVEVTVLTETMYLWPELTDVELPEGFEIGEITYQEQTIQTANMLQLNLVYITDEEGENGTFWNFNEETQEFYPYVKFSNQSTYVFLQPVESQSVPEGYSPASVEIEGDFLQGWVSEDTALKDYVLIYAMNGEGEEGFYLYDLVEETMQRFAQRILEVEVEIEPEPQSPVDKIFNDPVLAGILSALGLLVAGLAVSLVRVVQKNGSDDSEE